MKLDKPIILNPPSFTMHNGTDFKFSTIELNELEITIVDKNNQKKVLVHIGSIPRPFAIWEGKDYDLVGDYTQVQVEARVLDILGEKPAEFLEGLFDFQHQGMS